MSTSVEPTARPVTDIGLITMAFGRQKYFDQAEYLAKSLKLHMPDYKVCLICDRDYESPYFDQVVNMGKVETAGTVLKCRMYELSPFEETFFIDSDCIAVRDFSDQLEKIREWNFSPVCNTYFKDGDSDLWLEDVGQSLRAVKGDAFPKFNGGVYFFRKCEETETFFKTALEILDDYEAFGIKSFDIAGPGEETIFGMAMAKLKMGPFYDDGGKLMRTPLNSKGPIKLSVLEGVCTFEKEGKIVSPAICHFCGEWADHPAYTLAKISLDRNSAPSIIQTTSAFLPLFKKKAARKIKSVIKRAS